MNVDNLVRAASSAVVTLFSDPDVRVPIKSTDQLAALKAMFAGIASGALRVVEVPAAPTATE